MQREQRKLEHIKYALELGDGPALTHFADLRFVHNCLPEVNPTDIDISVTLWGKRLRLPFFIDAITGSADAVTKINSKLAQVAARCGIGLAVGSQYGAVCKGTGIASYKVVREENPQGLVFGNLSALATPQQALAAVEMLQADALELHLNAAQELCMAEGDKNYAGLWQNMQQILDTLPVPLIVKETGCGIAREQYEKFLAAGFSAFNCAGSGGTNFPAIEVRRRGEILAADMAAWGVPTCWSLLDGQIVPKEKILFASGGIRSGADVAKAFALGADAVGITGPVLRKLMESGVETTVKYLDDLANEFVNYLLLLGCKTPYELRRVPLIITGATREYIDCRGYNLLKLCHGRRA
ncbi:type 2 isopentenyl-diphosphate Delta-isomerase [uncultured Phascolarctobacterium sp.]|uniref:type 2 isopentenyl-diphosphate Delta-isomerase n=1 Tax=uncultured Phascolarctobacterium sp. TaxID=512296 RepID=UPI00262B2C98|nr:type 2 isopentenyl-diphosphate Delta-isomerase [uncultured Phascolarctobacterium sp.]